MLSLSLLISGLILGSSLALVTSGFSIIYATTGTFHIAHGLMYGVAGYTAFTFNVSWLHRPLVLAAILAAVITAVVGVLVEAFIYRPLKRRGANELAVFVASFGILVAGLATVQIIWGDTPKSYDISPMRSVVVVGDTFITDLQLATMGAAVAMFVLLAIIDRRTGFGLAMKSVAGNRKRAALLGVNVRLVEYRAFALGSSLVIPAAVLDGAQYGLSPTRGLQVVLLAIVAQIVGGLHGVTSGIAASYLIGLAGSLPLLYVDPKWQNSIIFSLLLIVLLFRPQGLFTPGAVRRYETAASH